MALKLNQALLAELDAAAFGRLCISPRQAALLLDISERSVYRLIEDGVIPVRTVLGKLRIYYPWLKTLVEEHQCIGTGTAPDPDKRSSSGARS